MYFLIRIVNKQDYSIYILQLILIDSKNIRQAQIIKYLNYFSCFLEQFLFKYIYRNLTKKIFRLYIGGISLKKKSRAIKDGVKSGSSGLQGCITDLYLDGRNIGFPEVLETYEVRSGCSWEFPCAAAPCTGKYSILMIFYLNNNKFLSLKKILCGVICILILYNLKSIQNKTSTKIRKRKTT